MPSEKEIEEAIRIERLQRDKHNSARSNYEALAEAYLSMKSERDAYKMDLGLAHIAIDHRNELLESCEQAFIEAQAERDKYKAIVEADNEWVDKLYDVRSEPDKLLIMVTYKHYAIHRPL